MIVVACDDSGLERCCSSTEHSTALCPLDNPPDGPTHQCMHCGALLYIPGAS